MRPIYVERSVVLDKDLDVAIGEAYREKLPETLCHYTNRAGLLGILRDRKIRAIKARAQEDCDELKHADSVIELVSRRFAGKIKLPRMERSWFAEQADDWRNVSASVRGEDALFIACFTDDPRNELLWSTRYADHHAGFAIEFELLREALDISSLGLTWGKVTYDSVQADARLSQAFTGIMSRWLRFAERTDRSLFVARRALWLACCYCAVFTKAPRYEGEHEWRMTAATAPGAVVIDTGPRPYVEVRLRQNPSDSPELRAIHLGRLADADAIRDFHASHYPSVPLVRYR